MVSICRLLTLAFLILIVGCATDKDTSKDRSSDASARLAMWDTLVTLSGNGIKKSPVFTLGGGTARIKYEVTLENDYGGLFSVYVMKDGTSLMEEGGFPEVMIDNKSENGESYLQKKQGKYYTHVQHGQLLLGSHCRAAARLTCKSHRPKLRLLMKWRSQRNTA